MNLIEHAYLLGLSLRQQSALRNRKRLPCRVVSIGNLTVGGTGKTPATIALAQEARKRGLRPVVLTRGYRGSAKGPCFVSRGEKPLLTHIEAGDEPLLMAERLRGVPIVKGADRHASGLFAISELGLRCPQEGLGETVFLLDDGFQHWGLHRDRDVLLIDALDPFGNNRLLPLGRLREPLTALSRADVIVITRCGDDDCQADRLVSTIREHNPRAPLFRAGHRVSGIRDMDGRLLDPAWLAGREVFGLCGLGNPGAFRSTITSLQAALKGFRSFRDHYPYRQADIAAVSREASALGARLIVTTEKDFIRMAGLDLPENLLIIEIEFAAEDGFCDAVLKP